jgi:hypothetical protein
LDQRLNAGQSVYLARILPNLPYRMRSLGPLVEVVREPQINPVTFGVSFGDELRLLGVRPEQGDPYRVTLRWQADSPQRGSSPAEAWAAGRSVSLPERRQSRAATAQMERLPP